MFWRKIADLKQYLIFLKCEQESSMEGLPDDLTGDDITYFKYAPITSTDVERSFSRYKTLLVDNRRSFNFENIKKSLVIQCNTFEGR